MAGEIAKMPPLVLFIQLHLSLTYPLKFLSTFFAVSTLPSQAHQVAATNPSAGSKHDLKFKHLNLDSH